MMIRAQQPYIVEYEGKVYKIGANADTDASLSTSKKDFTHKLCTLYAIASFCSENEVDEVKLAIGIPVKDYEMVKAEMSIENISCLRVKLQ